MMMQSVLKNLDSRLAMCLDIDGSTTTTTATRSLLRAPRVDSAELSPLRRVLYVKSREKPEEPEDSKQDNQTDRQLALLTTTTQQRQDNQYYVIYHDSAKKFVDDLLEKSEKPGCNISLKKYETNWGEFNDGSDDIKILGMTSPTTFKGKDMIFVASFHNNSVMMSQFHVIAFLCECLVGSLTVLLPYYPTGTMERVDINDDGVIPTANTLALLFNGLPSVGRPIRVMTYDLHTLQNRFYFGMHSVATLHTAVPLIVSKIEELKRRGGEDEITAVAFPDEGACKRFGVLFEKKVFEQDSIIICSKVRLGTTKVVTIADGKPSGKHVIIIDDQTKSGGTLIACAKKLKENGASRVSAFVTHAICTDEFWDKFIPVDCQETNNEGVTILTKKAPIEEFHKFYCTDSFPVFMELEKVRDHGRDLIFTTKTKEGAVTQTKKSTAGLIKNEIWKKLEILSLADLILKDL